METGCTATPSHKIPNSRLVRRKDHSRRVIEEYTSTTITQCVAKSVLVTVVNPLSNPKDRTGSRVFRII